MRVIYGSPLLYNKKPRKCDWVEYQKKILNRQPLWWILETLYLDKKPLGYTKAKIINENIDNLWDCFLDGLDPVK